MPMPMPVPIFLNGRSSVCQKANRNKLNYIVVLHKLLLSVIKINFALIENYKTKKLIIFHGDYDTTII